MPLSATRPPSVPSSTETSRTRKSIAGLVSPGGGPPTLGSHPRRRGAKAVVVALVGWLVVAASASADTPEPRAVVRGMAAVEAVRDADRHPGMEKSVFDARYPERLFEAKLARQLAQSEWLAERQGTIELEAITSKTITSETITSETITSEDLQAELDRMARETRRPEKLRQLFAVLGNDPDLIAEVLVRPALVERRLRRLAAEGSREEPGEGTFADLDGEIPDWDTIEHQAREVLDARGLVLPKILGVGTDTPDSWTRELPEGPPARRGQSHLWTGSELIVWGGAVASLPSSGLWSNAGYRYDPVSDSWSTLRIDGSTPSPRAYHSAVWTGDAMIIWGGESWDESADPPFFTALGDGGRYDPVADRWFAVPDVGAPSPRLEHAAVWTGTEMVVWGGLVPEEPTTNPPPEIPDYLALDDGARYDPAFGGWTAMGDTPPSARGRAAAAWTGDAMFVVGGFDGIDWIDPGSDATAFSSYDPSTDQWETTLDQPPAGGMTSPPFEAPVALWTGESLWVAQPASGRLLARYTATGWSEPPPPPSTSDRRYVSLSWTGRRLILWGGVTGMPGMETIRGEGLILDTQTNQWSTLPRIPGESPARRFGHFGTWTGSELLIWGGFRSTDPFGGTSRPAGAVSTGGRVTPDWAQPNDGGSWEMLPTPPTLASRDHSQLWTGSELLIWGGRIGQAVKDGTIYNPAIDRWSSMTQTDAPNRRSRHTAVWTGSEMVVWGGSNENDVPLATGGRYDPALDQWTATGGSPPAARTDHTAVWSGTEMVVWGGFDATGDGLATGGRYDPALDQWTATGGTPPTARGLHTAVWTGDAMTVYGGLTGCPGSCTPTAETASYDPALDQWGTPFSATPAEPAGPEGADGRWSHTAVWAGDSLLVWGGTNTYDATNPCLDTGLAIDPLTGTSTPLMANGAGRCNHTAIWNGAEMIVWGGSDRVNTSADGGVPEVALSSGGRYDPQTATWSTTPDNDGTPPGTSGHTATWTGEEMLVWGGRPEVSGSLAVYYTDTVPTSSPDLAIDGATGSTVLLGGDDETISLGHTLPVAFYDDVEGDEQWVVGSEGGGATWHVSLAGTCSDGGDYASPLRAWRFGEVGGCRYTGSAGTFTLTSTATFEIGSSTLLELRYLLGTDRVSNPSEQDGARIEVSADDGVSWTVVAVDEENAGGGAMPQPVPLDSSGTVWRGLALPLEQYVGTTSLGKVRFVFERNGSLNDQLGWLLDDLGVGEPSGDGRLPSGALMASDGSPAFHAVASHDRWDRPSFAWDLDGDGLADNGDPGVPDFELMESDLASYGIATPGTYALTLTVSDLGGQSDSATVDLEVVDGEPPVVEVLSPNGGEAWSAGSTQVVSWSASDNIGLAGFDLAWVDDEAGTGPMPIVCEEPIDGDSRSCTWVLPDTTSTAARVEITARDQRPEPGGPNTASDASDAPFYLVQANSDAIRTLVVWHRDRIETLFGTSETEALGASLATFAAHPKVDGLVLDLANVPSLDPLYVAWDGTAWGTGTVADLDDNIAQANALAMAIRNYLFEQISQAFTNLETLVLVGGDALIPFWRLDEDLPRYPESFYIGELQTFGLLDDASTPEAFCDETEHPTLAAICRDHYPADTPYGASFTTTVPGSSFTWWMPDLAVGRLVETPEQIVGLVDVFIAQDGVTVVDKALTTGYDFLTDGGDAVHALLQGDLDLGETTLARLSQSAGLWSDDDLLGELFGVATEPADVAFVLGHADHRAEGAAQVGDAGILTTLEMEAAMVDNRGGVLVGVGCHSGLPMALEGGAADETDPAFLLDLPEILAQRKFPAMIGNGGYGWALSEGVGLGEQLVALIADELLRAGQLSLGEALRLAKQEYFLRQDRLDAFDHKVLHEAMLFGIPNYEVRMILEPVAPRRGEGSWAGLGERRDVRDEARAHGPRVPGRPWLGDPEWSRLQTPSGRVLSKGEVLAVTRSDGLAGPEKGDGASTLRILDFSFQAFERGQDTDGDPKTADWQEAYDQFDWCTDAEGESLLCSGDPGETPVGTFFTLDTLASAESGRPIQPMISFDSRLFGTELHGILIRGGEYLQPAAINPQDPTRCTDVFGTVHPCFDPVVGNPETEVDEEEGPAPTPFVNFDAPTPFVNFDAPTPNGFFENGGGGDPVRFDTLNAPMGVAVRRGVREDGDERSEIFSEWLYRTRDFTNYYSNSSDWTAPEIGDFTADCSSEIDGADCFHTVAGSVSAGGTVTFDVPVTDAGEGIFKVFVTLTQDVDGEGDGAWQTFELTPTGPDQYGGSLEIVRNAYYLVQAVDWAGNIGTVRITGDDVGADGLPIGSKYDLPQLFTAELPRDPGEPPMFADGFETGDTSGWSSENP